MLVLDGNEVYHKKPLIDTKSGEVMSVSNNVSLANNEFDDLSSSQMAKKDKKIGALKAHMSNFMNTGVF